MTITRGYDALQRPASLSLANGSATPPPATAYAYDGASRMATVTSGAEQAVHGYLANSPLVQQISLTEGGAGRLTRG